MCIYRAEFVLMVISHVWALLILHGEMQFYARRRSTDGRGSQKDGDEFDTPNLHANYQGSDLCTTNIWRIACNDQ